MRRLCFALILCLFPIAGNTQPLPSPISPYVNDLANLLEEKDWREVTDMLKTLQEDTGIQNGAGLTNNLHVRRGE